MNVILLLSCLVLAATEYTSGSAYMVPEDNISTNQVVASKALSQSLDARSPPVIIVELPKVKKNKRTKKQKKNKFVRKRPPPPPNCIPVGGSCKSVNSVCCDFCAFCQCRLFRTVCYCRMGNPRC